MLSALKSPQDFIRALKAPCDPPQPGGSFKIQIATQAWDRSAFYIPNKGQAIVDWLLMRLLKGKSKDGEPNPIVDMDHWLLLANIISPLSQNDDSRRIKAWLAPLLNRTPIIPIIIAYLNVLPSLSSTHRESLSVPFLRCFRVLWPLATQKVSLDTLLDCFGAFLGLLAAQLDPAGPGQTEFLAILGSMIITSYRNALFNFSNKKKLYTSFITNHLQTWLRCIFSTSNATVRHPLFAEAYTAGVETLFCIDVLRQLTEGNSENNLLDNLSKISPSIVFPALPSLLLSFCQAVRKSRGTLFGQSHESGPAFTLDQIHSSEMKFYAVCDSLLWLGENIPRDVWKTRTSLLEIVGQENIFSAAHASYGHLLEENTQQALGYLKGHPYEPEHVELVFQTLCALATIDYDIVAPSVPSILSVVAKTSSVSPSTTTFLKLLLDYHQKTRTVPTHLLNLLESLGPGPLQIDDPREVYQTVFTGSIFEFAHLHLLTKSVSNFVTPGQCLELVKKTGEILQHTWRRFQEIHDKLRANVEDGARKELKLDEKDAAKHQISQPSEQAAVVISFTFLCRIVGVIWTSIPINSVPDDVKTMIRDSVDNFRTGVIFSGLKGMKHIYGSERRGLDTWPWEVAAAAILRLQYTLTASRRFGDEFYGHEEVEPRMMKILGSGGVLPELKLEIARCFLSRAVQNKASSFEPMFDFLLNHIELLLETEAVQWKGRSSELVKGHEEQSAVALLHILVDRWLPVIEEIASTKQLERFVRVLLHSGTSQPPQYLSNDGVSPQLIYRMALRSAEFWELANLRNVILSYLDNETSGLDQVDLLQALGMLQNRSRVVTPPVNVRQIMTSYETLLFAPVEYISKNVRAVLLRRGLTADVVSTTLSLGDREHDAEILRMKTILREFSKRVFSWLNAVDYPAVYEMTEYLIDSRWVGVVSTQEKLMETTLELIEMHFSALEKSAEKGQSKGFVKICQRLLALEAFEAPGTHFDQKIIIRFLDVVNNSTLIFQASPDVIGSLRALASSLANLLVTRLSEITSSASESGRDKNLVLPEAWCKTLALRRFLKIDDELPQFGTSIVRKVLSCEACHPDDKSLIECCKSGVSVLLAELQDCPAANRECRLRLTVATYVSLYRLCGSSDSGQLDSTIASACGFLSVAEFSYVLDFSLESLSAPDTTPQELEPLVHLTRVLLHQAPEGTMKICQPFTTGSLNLFLDRAVFWIGSSSLKLAVLAFVSGVCSNRPASIRSADVICIWAILSKLLVATETHDETTSVEIFHEVVATISALIRLRRDLVLPMLPHLGMILRQLVMTIRSVRPQLGGKQSKMIRDTFPSWVNPDQPLGQEEAKGLARLFATLTTKTVIRVFGPNPDSQKAESLARPFGRHTAYILMAYIEAMNDPLCVISTDVRKELYPGLFALCDMLNDHDRGALMVSALHGGGKITMKSLWKEYEKQKYVGKG